MPIRTRTAVGRRKHLSERDEPDCCDFVCVRLPAPRDSQGFCGGVVTVEKGLKETTATTVPRPREILELES